LTRLKESYVIAPLSNGNVALLVDMAKAAGLPWDLILSAELVRHYKPDPEAYLMAPDLLDLSPDQVIMVAAHKNDLHAARENGLRTAYVPRPLEFGPGGEVDPPDPSFDLAANNFAELAEKLGA
jgi:2-haloacid dehalogenase